MVDLSQRTEGNAPAESETTPPKSGSYRPVHGPRPAWPRPGEIKAAIQDQDAGGDPVPEQDFDQELASDQHADAVSEIEQEGDASEAEAAAAQGSEDASPDTPEDAEDIVTEYRSYETDAGSESLGTAASGSAWAAASAALPEQGYRSCHTPAAERLQRLGSVDMVDDLVAAEADEQSNLMSSAPIKPGLDLDDEAMFEREAEADELAPRTVVFEDESVAADDESIADRLVPTSTVAAALARQATQTQAESADSSTHQFIDRSYAAQDRDPSRAPRMPATPKWSESARQHMSNLLAASAENNSAAAMAARIDTSADRYRRSSAMLLLGLPALLLLGFGGAYLYHADTASKGRSIVAGLQSAVSATAIGVATEQKLSPSGKITESIIEKQEAEKAATVARPEPNLPPPVAPELAEDAAPASKPPVKVVEAQPVAPAEPAAQPAVSPPSDSDSRSGIVLNWPTAKKPVVAEQPEPVIKSEPRATAAAPKITITAPTTAAKIKPAEESKEPTITPTAADPLQPGVIVSDPAVAGTGTAETTGSQQIAALNLPKPAVPETKSEATPAAVPTEPAAGLGSAPEQDDESAQLVARGNEHLEIGDIVAARLLFELAVSNGSATAATAMGRSYDPTYFETMGVRGVRPDAGKAAEWYEKAIAAGDPAAKADLQKLTAWLKQ